MLESDLELLLSWRSHPDAYIFFKSQKGPLRWSEHFNFWHNRKNRVDFIIFFKESKRWRKVGSINLSRLETELPEIGIIIGEMTLHGNGIGTKALSLGLEWLKDAGYKKALAVINTKNEASKKIFSKNGFEKKHKIDVWEEYTKNL